MNYGTIGKGIWQDPFFGDLTPEERHFFIYLNSCPQGQMCGVWPFNKRLAAAETGFNEETIMRLVDRMVHNIRAEYDPVTREILLVGWAERNAGLFRSSAGPYKDKKENSTVIKIKKEMLNIKNIDFRQQVEQWLADGASTGGEPSDDGAGNRTTTKPNCTIPNGTDTTTPKDETSCSSFLASPFGDQFFPHLPVLYSRCWAGAESDLRKAAAEYGADVYRVADQIDHQKFFERNKSNRNNSPLGLLLMHFRGQLPGGYTPFKGYSVDWREQVALRKMPAGTSKPKPAIPDMNIDDLEVRYQSALGIFCQVPDADEKNLKADIEVAIEAGEDRKIATIKIVEMFISPKNIT